ncbi:MAG: TonB-dependent receptor [Gemmatimonadota bacterium]|nr:TonB-dependent receptor [Gemmatimonadota bacterium]
MSDWLALACVLFTPATALASTTFAGALEWVQPAVIGSVRDTAGAPLPNAQVIVAAVGRVASTDHGGRFTLRALPPGHHHIQVLLIGYAPAHADVDVPVSGPDVTVDLVMRPTALRLSSVQVTASPLGADPLDITQSTHELSGKHLERNLGASVAQTLSREPGIQMRYAGPAAAAPVIRGLTDERILVLQDGVRAGDLSSSSADHGVSIDPLAATRIEVVRGPASLLYGNNALGGVVNVISNDLPTSVPSHREAYAATQGETANPGGALAAGVTLPVSQSVALTIRGGGRRLEDVRVGGGARLNNSYSRNLYGVAGLGYVGARGSAGLGLRGFGFDYGLPAGEEGVHIEGWRAQLLGQGGINVRNPHLTYVKVDGTAQTYTHDEIEPTGEIGTTFRLRTQTFGLNAKTQFGPLDGAVGVSGLFKQYDPQGEEALTPAANSNAGGVFLYQELPFGGAVGGDTHEAAHGGLHGTAHGDPHERRRPTLQLGARYDAYAINTRASADPRFAAAASRSFSNVSGSVGVSLPLGRAGSVGFSAARAFRAPTVEELYSNGFHAAAGSFDVGNPDLDAEINQGLDAVLRIQSQTVSIQLSSYYNRVGNYIAAVPIGTVIVDGEEFPQIEYRQRDATLTGAEGTIETNVTRHVVVGLMGDVTRGRFTDGSPLPFMPSPRLGGTARWDNAGLTAGVDVRHAFRQPEPPASEFRTDAYTLVDVQLGWSFIGRSAVNSITFRVDNLVDTEYREATSRIKQVAANPGRNLSLVYRVLF